MNIGEVVGIDSRFDGIGSGVIVSVSLDGKSGKYLVIRDNEMRAILHPVDDAVRRESIPLIVFHVEVGANLSDREHALIFINAHYYEYYSSDPELVSFFIYQNGGTVAVATFYASDIRDIYGEPHFAYDESGED